MWASWVVGVCNVSGQECVCLRDQSVRRYSAGETLKSALMEFPVRSFSHHHVAVIFLTP